MSSISGRLKRAGSLALLLTLGTCNTSLANEMKTIEFLGLNSSLPAAWIEQNPSSSMRLAQFRVPGTGSNGDASMVLYYFGQGQGGSAEANIARWQSQFSDPKGGTVTPKIENMDVRGMPVTVVELEGDYARNVGMGPSGIGAPDQILLAAIVETPKGNIFIQLHGPAATVSSQRGAYMDFLRNIAATD